MAKRSSIVGRGADIFLSDASGLQTQKHTERSAPENAFAAKRPSKSQAKKQRRTKEETVKLTVYIRPELNVQLDQLWLQRRLNDINAQKSLIVEEALQLLFERETLAKQ